MKLRLKDNSIRLRLSQKDVATLAAEGCIKEQISFTKDITLTYQLMTQEEILSPGVTYADNTITVLIQKDFANEWPGNNVVGTSAHHTTIDGNEIFILIEKDFKCLDDTMEDQSDNFDNPKLMNQK